MKMTKLSSYAAVFVIGAALTGPSLAAPFGNGSSLNGGEFNGSMPNGGNWNGSGYNNGSWNGSAFNGDNQRRTAQEELAASQFNLNNVTVRGVILNLTPQRPEAK